LFVAAVLKPVKYDLSIQKQPYVLTITPGGFTLVPKGRRKGIDLKWADLVSGDAALAVALNASVKQTARWGVGAGTAGERVKKG
jgi:hypothetical protein